MTFLEDLKDEMNYTETENGAIALNSTMNACLDAFGSLGAMKDFNEQKIIDTFNDAFREDRATAMKILFYMRDARGGQGMHRVFRVIVSWLANNYPEYVVNNLTNFAEYGRWDDLLCLLDTRDTYVKEETLSLIKDQILKDICEWYDNGSVSLLAKWLPSENASSAETKRYAKIIREYLGWSPKSYRKTLTKLRKYLDVVETKMSANNWNTIHYENVPGKASLNYSNAFERHDEERYINYLMSADNLNARSLFPVDIIHNVFQKGVSPTTIGKVSKKDRILLEKMWNSLPNYFDGKEETGICVCDTSGSMYGTPLEVSLSLGIYCADKCRGPFHNHFITFSESPELVELKGSDICEKVSSVGRINAWNTDLEKVFDLLLTTAIRHNTPDSDMPRKLYIISDMQFDEARGANESNYYYKYHPENAPRQTFMASMRKKYEDAGYTFPSIVYWNVRQSSKGGMFQEKFDGEDCAIVSGYSASLFKSVIEGTTYEEEVKDNGDVTVRERLDPMTVMMNTLNNPRYERVWVG